MKHLLLNQAIELKNVEPIRPPGDYAYDNLSGNWKNVNGSLLINDERFAGVATKKFDIETGEDQKR